MNSLDEQRMIELLRHQQVLYRRLRQLSDRQKQLVMREDAEGLLEILSERQRLVDGLVGLSGLLAPFRERWSEIYGKLEEPRRREVAELLEEANQSLGSILSSDSTDSATLTARKQGMASELAGYSAAGRATAAYASAGNASKSTMTEARA